MTKTPRKVLKNGGFQEKHRFFVQTKIEVSESCKK